MICTIRSCLPGGICFDTALANTFLLCLWDLYDSALEHLMTAGIRSRRSTVGRHLSDVVKCLPTLVIISI